MNLALISFLLLAVNFSQRIRDEDPYLGIEPDTGRRLHEFGRPATGYPTTMKIPDSNFAVKAGPSRYNDEDDEDWDYYSISIERDLGDTSYVFFRRDYEIKEIPKNLIDANIKDLARYDASTRTVQFTIGSIRESYTIPEEK